MDIASVKKIDYTIPEVRALNPGPPRYQYLGSSTSTSTGFGSGIDTGDYNGDGYDDIALRASGRKQRNGTGYLKGGNVYVMYGSALGITTEDAAVYNQDTLGIAGKDEKGDRFGFTLNSGDLNNDGYDELVISVPFEDFKTRPSGGSVQILPGSVNGVDPLSSYGIHMYKTGFNNPPQGNKHRHQLQYGLFTTIADLNNDGDSDLVVATPRDAIEFRERMPGDSHSDWRHVHAGSIHILPSGRLEQSRWLNSELVDQEVRKNTSFSNGFITSGDFNNDGNLDLVTTGRFFNVDESSVYGLIPYIIFGDGTIPDSNSELEFINIPINTDIWN